MCIMEREQALCPAVEAEACLAQRGWKGEGVPQQPGDWENAADEHGQCCRGTLKVKAFVRNS